MNNDNLPDKQKNLGGRPKNYKFEIPKLLKDTFDNPTRALTREEMITASSVLIKKYLLRFEKLNQSEIKLFKELCEFHSKLCGWMETNKIQIPQVTLSLNFAEPEQTEKIAEKLIKAIPILEEKKEENGKELE